MSLILKVNQRIAPFRSVISSRFSTAATVVESSGNPSPLPNQNNGASMWQKLLAFSAGVALGSAYYLFTVQETWKSDDALALEVKMLRKETIKNSVEFRERVALLEHEVSSLKRELNAWERGRLGK